MSKYGVFSGSSAGKYRPEKTPYLDTFHVVLAFETTSLDNYLYSFFIRLETGHSPKNNLDKKELETIFEVLPLRFFFGTADLNRGLRGKCLQQKIFTVVVKPGKEVKSFTFW